MSIIGGIPARVGRVVRDHSRVVVAVGIIIATGVALALIVASWEWLSAGESGSTTIRNLALVLAGVIALPLAWWRSVVADRQATTAERGLLNERYQKGAEMLGSGVLSVRLAGIYALQRLAAEHPEQYHVQGMRLFCAFVRLPTEDQGLERGQAAIRPGTFLGIRQDVDSVMNAIGSRSEAKKALEQMDDFGLDLRGANLSETQILNADLSNAMFHHANLSAVHFTRTNLAGTYFLGADLSNARFWDVNFTVRTSFEFANLSGTILQDAEMAEISFNYVDLSGAVLTRANLSGARFQYAKLIGVLLERANLAGTLFLEADLSGSIFVEANLSNTEFIAVDLTGARLSDVNLSGAQFSSSSLQPVKGLTQAQLDQARADPANPPQLDGVLDAETHEQLVWRGKPLDV